MPHLVIHLDLCLAGSRGSNEKTGFPFITIQKCGDDYEGPGSRSPRQKSPAPAPHSDMKVRTGAGSPAGGSVGSGSPAISPRTPTSPLLAPATPPGQPHVGAKQYVVYNKDGQQTVRSYSREDLGVALPPSPGLDRHPMGLSSPRKGTNSPRDTRTDVTPLRTKQKPVRLEPLGGR